MRSHRLAILSLVALCLAGLTPLAHGQDARDMRLPKKLLEVGWDTPDTSQVRRNLAVMEKRPFDGIMINAVGQAGGDKRVQLRAAFAPEPWQREWFAPCVADLKACRFRRFTDNFLMTGANPGSVDWFDDAGWKNIVEHMRIAAWIAHEGGLKGITFDPEPYTDPYKAFQYPAQAQRDRHTFNEYYAKAHQRGREVMQAIAGEYPDLTVLAFFMNIVNSASADQADPREALAQTGYGLYAPFVDGWLEAAPPTVTIIDGCENSYLYNSRQPFVDSALFIKGEAQSLVSPQNRAKYRAQVQVSFGIYMDAYANKEGSHYFIDGLGGPRVNRLAANTGTALQVADEYVWVYGEQYHWWPADNDPNDAKSWTVGLPGCEAALAFARDPLGYGRERLAEMQQAGQVVELARNGDFSSDKAAAEGGGMADWKQGAAPAGWSTWSADPAKGAFTWDKETGATAQGAARGADVADGCFIQSYAVKPGERYVVRAVGRTEGKGQTRIRIRWQTPEGQWTLVEQDKIIMPAEGPAGSWRPMFGVVQVPDGVGKLILLLGVGGQTSAADAAWFDDVHVNKL